MNREIARTETRALEEYDEYGTLVELMGDGRELGINEVAKVLGVSRTIAASLMSSVAQAYLEVQKAVALATYAQKNFKRLQRVVDGEDDALAVSASKELTEQLGIRKHAPLINQNLNVSIDQLIKKITRGEEE